MIRFLCLSFLVYTFTSVLGDLDLADFFLRSLGSSSSCFYLFFNEMSIVVF
jgi:hypothetical protein